MRARSVSSMYGPFLSERPIPGLLFLPAGHDAAIRGPGPPPGLVALGGLAPRRHRVVALALALAATHRVIDRVHHRSPDGGTEAAPAHAPGLADRNILVVEVAHLADRGHALQRHEADFPRG